MLQKCANVSKLLNNSSEVNGAKSKTTLVSKDGDGHLWVYLMQDVYGERMLSANHFCKNLFIAIWGWGAEYKALKEKGRD